jgi:succinyl-CoA synthetase alpha subunit
VIIVGEVGGEQEEQAAEFIKEDDQTVAAYIAGRHSPQGKRMGHAGAIVRGSAGTVAGKKEALRAAGRSPRKSYPRRPVDEEIQAQIGPCQARP